MSVVFSGSFSGAFTSNGQNRFIPLPSGVDWMWVYNETVQYATGAGTGAQFYWRRGMPVGRGTEYKKEATVGGLVPSQIAANGGFFLQDTTLTDPGAFIPLTGIATGVPPIVATANTAGLIPFSSIVRLYNSVGATELMGIDFTVGTIAAGASFQLAYMGSVPAAAAPGAGAGYRIIPFDPYFYPAVRYITKISKAAQAIITLSVKHTLKVGQTVRLSIPEVTAAAFGMTALDGLSVTIVAVNQPDVDGVTNTITIDVDTSAMTPFAFPLTTDPAFTPATVIPYGENTGVAIANSQDILADSVYNTGQVGMLLMAGADSPAGVDTNIISWVAGKSFNQ